MAPSTPKIKEKVASLIGEGADKHGDFSSYYPRRKLSIMFHWAPCNHGTANSKGGISYCDDTKINGALSHFEKILLALHKPNDGVASRPCALFVVFALEQVEQLFMESSNHFLDCQPTIQTSAFASVESRGSRVLGETSKNGMRLCQVANKNDEWLQYCTAPTVTVLNFGLWHMGSLNVSLSTFKRILSGVPNDSKTLFVIVLPWRIRRPGPVPKNLAHNQVPTQPFHPHLAHACMLAAVCYRDGARQHTLFSKLSCCARIALSQHRSYSTFSMSLWRLDITLL